MCDFKRQNWPLLLWKLCRQARRDETKGGPGPRVKQAANPGRTERNQSRAPPERAFIKDVSQQQCLYRCQRLNPAVLSCRGQTHIPLPLWCHPPHPSVPVSSRCLLFPLLMVKFWSLSLPCVHSSAVQFLFIFLWGFSCFLPSLLSERVWGQQYGECVRV